MSTTETPQNEPADDLAQGIIPTAKQAWRDLFIWKQRVVLSNEYGETRCEWRQPDRIQNPISLFAQLSLRDWLFFLVGFASWTADAFDFHALSIQTKKLADYYDQSKTNITTAITLTLLFRSVGAAIFGLAGDKYGRKWPMVLNMVVLGVLQIATIYSRTFAQFLAVRSLFGIFMGGVYGNAIAMALEHCPSNARGLMSGILQQGYSLGYVLAACANLGVGDGPESWKTVFWVAAGLSIGIGLIRTLFPESKQFLEAKEKGDKVSSPGAFWRDIRQMLSKEWRICVYCIILSTWFNYYSHTSQDSYTTFMLTQKELDNSGASRASIIMKTGACVGGTIVGYLSQFFGRRRAIICSALISGLLIPAWILPEGERSLSASGFFMQFFVQGAWGVIPIHLNELSPVAFRSTFPGLTYQLGNMISSPSTQIVNGIAENVFITLKSGDVVEAYGPTMGVATAIIVMGIVVTTMFGPERRGRQFEHAVAGLESKSKIEPIDEEKGNVEDKGERESVDHAEKKRVSQ
ncbi:probable permeases of the major facilitator superfamily [Cephalotrichum gorgonifer]|uniref:Probable permeases of the major facilitator superfamily n=1 Tax=Cephalotrichum gorgonifer TaxID=2041049 RepID=A0AAE8N8J7_9PEZI|nr:probable permeases of the major facilitator superfamily [Cephalotrichum gorgonifer]